MTATNADDLIKSDGKTNEAPATIKLQMLQKGKKGKFVDIDLQNEDNPFNLGFKWCMLCLGLPFGIIGIWYLLSFIYKFYINHDI